MSEAPHDSMPQPALHAPVPGAPVLNDLDRILEIPLNIHVELGRKRMRIHELLAVDVGSVVELGTPAGTPLSIYANNVLVAQGEAVIVGERYGIRITDIVPASERVRRLGGKDGA